MVTLLTDYYFSLLIIMSDNSRTPYVSEPLFIRTFWPVPSCSDKRLDCIIMVDNNSSGPRTVNGEVATLYVRGYIHGLILFTL